MSLSSMSTNPQALLVPLYDPITVVDETPSQPWLVDHPKLLALTAARRQRLDDPTANERVPAPLSDAQLPGFVRSASMIEAVRDPADAAPSEALVVATSADPLALELAHVAADASDAVTVGAYAVATPRAPLVPDDFAAQLPGDAELVDAAIGSHQRLVFTAALAAAGLVAGVAIALVSSL